MKCQGTAVFSNLLDFEPPRHESLQALSMWNSEPSASGRELACKLQNQGLSAN